MSDITVHFWEPSMVVWLLSVSVFLFVCLLLFSPGLLSQVDGGNVWFLRLEKLSLNRIE